MSKKTCKLVGMREQIGSHWPKVMSESSHVRYSVSGLWYPTSHEYTDCRNLQLLFPETSKVQQYAVDTIENQNLYSKTLNFIEVPGMNVSPLNSDKDR